MSIMRSNLDIRDFLEHFTFDTPLFCTKACHSFIYRIKSCSIFLPQDLYRYWLMECECLTPPSTINVGCHSPTRIWWGGGKSTCIPLVPVHKRLGVSLPSFEEAGRSCFRSLGVGSLRVSPENWFDPIPLSSECLTGLASSLRQ